MFAQTLAYHKIAFYPLKGEANKGHVTEFLKLKKIIFAPKNGIVARLKKKKSKKPTRLRRRIEKREGKAPKF